MRRYLLYALIVFLTNFNLGIIPAFANDDFSSTRPMLSDVKDGSLITYEELNMFKEVAEYGELSENELREVVTVLKNCGLVNNEWHIRFKGGAIPNPWDGCSSASYEYTRKNIDIGYRVIGQHSVTKEITNFVEDIKFEVSVYVSEKTRQIKSVSLIAYSDLGNNNSVDYPLIDKYTHWLNLYEDGKYFVNLADIKIDDQYGQTIFNASLMDLKRQYGDSSRCYSAHFAPIFNVNNEVFAEVSLYGDLVKKIYGYPDGKVVKKFRHLYIFDKNGKLMDCVRGTTDYNQGM